MAVSGRLLVFVVGVCLFACLCEVGGRRGGGSRFSGRYRSSRYGGSSGGTSGGSGMIVGAIFGGIGGIVAIVIVVVVCRAFCCKSDSSASSPGTATTTSSQGVVTSSTTRTTPAHVPQSFYNKQAYDETDPDNGFRPPPSYESAVNADQSGDTYPTKNDYSYSVDAPGFAYQPSSSGDVSYPAHPAPAYSAEFTPGAASYSNASDGATPPSAPQYAGIGTATPTAIGFETTPIEN